MLRSLSPRKRCWNLNKSPPG